MKKIRILTIDGGGIRGIIPAVILDSIEKLLQIKTGNPNAMIADYFDMIAGTSTGGILTTLLILPDNEDKTKGRYFASQAVDLYKKHGKHIFKKRLPLMSKIFGSIYSEKGLEEVLNEKIGDVKLSEVRKHCLITAYDINSRNAVFFTSPIKYDNRNYYMRDIARATSAAPTYFPPAKIESLSKKYAYLIDGGIYANDPTMSAIMEARKMNFQNYGHPDFRDMYIVSIGTGKQLQSYDYEKAKKWGTIGWAAPVIDMMLSSSAEVVSYQVKKLFEAINRSSSYVRIEPDLCNANSDLDDASDKNVTSLEQAGLNYVNANIDLLDKIVDELLKSKL